MSSFNRPTWGAVSREGIAQWSFTLDTCGFFSRSIDDLNLLLNVFRIQDDEPTPEVPFDLRGAKVGFCKTHNWPKAGRGTQNAMEKAKEILNRHGAVIEDVELPNDFGRVLDWHATVLNMEGRSSFLGQYLTDASLLHDDIAGYVENRKHVSHKDQLEAYDNCARLRPIWDNIASQYDIILTPSVIDEAPEGFATGDMVIYS